MLSKLPEETLRSMARNQQNVELTIQELQTALRNEIRIFEQASMPLLPVKPIYRPQPPF